VKQAPLDLERPTRVRYRVLLLLCGLRLILYLDRMCLGKAAPSMQRDLGLSDRQLGMVHASFTVSYAVFEVVPNVAARFQRVATFGHSSYRSSATGSRSSSRYTGRP
jgi:hypothetical protein